MPVAEKKVEKMRKKLGGTLLTQKIFDAQNFNVGILTPGVLSLDGI